jgi:hypothetical protein
MVGLRPGGTVTPTPETTLSWKRTLSRHIAVVDCTKRFQATLDTCRQRR